MKVLVSAARAALHTVSMTRRPLRGPRRSSDNVWRTHPACLRAPRRSRQKLILIAGTVHCWLVVRPRAQPGPACHRLIDKALSVLGAAAPKRWRAIAILTRPPLAWRSFEGETPLKGDLLNLPLGDSVLSTQY